MTGRTGCKVDHTIERYDLTPPGSEYDSLDDYLVARWTGAASGDAVGYKDLTTWFNRRLLKRVYEREGRSTLGTRLESEYEALTGDDELVRAEVADDLAADGIDVERVTSDMVSWSTMRRHLKDCLEADKETAQATSDWEVESIEIARDRLETKTGDALRSLETKDKLPDATRANVDVQVKVSCPECPTRVPIEDALDRGYICESHFEEANSAERVRLSEKLGAALPAGVASTASLDGSSLVFDLFEAVGTELSTVTMEIGPSLAL